MPEKEIKGIKKFFEEFKAFAMRGNVLDMASRRGRRRCVHGHRHGSG